MSKIYYLCPIGPIISLFDDSIESYVKGKNNNGIFEY